MAEDGNTQLLECDVTISIKNVSLETPTVSDLKHLRIGLWTELNEYLTPKGTHIMQVETEGWDLHTGFHSAFDEGRENRKRSRRLAIPFVGSSTMGGVEQRRGGSFSGEHFLQTLNSWISDNNASMYATRRLQGDATQGVGSFAADLSVTLLVVGQQTAKSFATKPLLLPESFAKQVHEAVPIIARELRSDLTGGGPRALTYFRQITDIQLVSPDDGGMALSVPSEVSGSPMSSETTRIGTVTGAVGGQQVPSASIGAGDSQEVYIPGIISEKDAATLMPDSPSRGGSALSLAIGLVLALAFIGFVINTTIIYSRRRSIFKRKKDRAMKARDAYDAPGEISEGKWIETLRERMMSRRNGESGGTGRLRQQKQSQLMPSVRLMTDVDNRKNQGGHDPYATNISAPTAEKRVHFGEDHVAGHKWHQPPAPVSTFPKSHRTLQAVEVLNSFPRRGGLPIMQSEQQSPSFQKNSGAYGLTL